MRIVHKSADVVEGIGVAGGVGFRCFGGFIERKGVGAGEEEILRWKWGEIKGFLRGSGAAVGGGCGEGTGRVREG
jgi:hypothetical protein